MLKILMISSSPIKNDGLTKVEREIIAYNQDINFGIAACIEEYDIAEKFRKLGCTVVKLPQKKRILAYENAIKTVVSTGNYDAVYIHGNSAMMFFEALPVYKLHEKIRILAHSHNTRTLHPFVHRILKKPFNKMLNEKIGCSSLAAEWAFEGKNIHVILNGIDLEKYQTDLRKRETIRQALGWSENKIFGHIGRFTEQKNHKFLIEIFKKITLAQPEARLLLIGQGELQNNVRDQIRLLGLENKVKIIDATEDVPGYLNAMDAMIMPSLYEGLCLVALEAQANGLPTLISDTMAPETVISNHTQVLSLNDSAKLWSNAAVNASLQPHHDIAGSLKGTAVDRKNMMSEIRKILLKSGK